MASIEQSIATIGKRYDLTSQFTYRMVDAPNVVNCSKLHGFVEGIVAGYGLPTVKRGVSFTREDFSYFGQGGVPAYLLHIGCAPVGRAGVNLGHTPQFVVDVGLLPIGVRTFVDFALLLP